MKMLLERYVLKEISIPFFLSLLIMIILMLIQRMILITDWVVNRGVPLVYVAQLLALSMPFFLTIVTPVALLLATLLTINRLSADSEITAMKAAGISVARLFLPAMLLGVFCTLATSYLTLYGIPRAAQYTESLKMKLAKTSARAAIAVKGFVEIGEGFTLYVDSLDGDKLRGVMLSKLASRRKVGEGPQIMLVFAGEGNLTSDPEKPINYLNLHDGEIQASDWDGVLFRRIMFENFDIKIDLSQADDDKEIERGTMFELMDIDTLNKRKAEIEADVKKLKKSDMDSKAATTLRKRYRIALRQIEISRHQKYGLPVACLVLVLWGIPLGIQPPRTTRHQGVITSILLTIAYYVMVNGGKILSLKGAIPAYVAIWGPNIVVVVTGIVFIYLVANDKPLPFAVAIVRLTDLYNAAAAKLGKGKPA